MFSLIKYEFHKLFSKSLVIFLFAGLIAVNIGLFCNVQNNKAIIKSHSLKAYKDSIHKYSSIPIESSIEDINNTQNLLSIFELFSNNASYNNNHVLEQEVKKMLEESPEAAQKFKNSKYVNHPEAILTDELLTNMLKSNIDYIYGYSNYLEAIQKNKDKMLQVSIFYKKGSFLYNNIIKTAKDFSKLKNVALTIDNNEGINSISSFNLVDIFMLVMIFIMCVYLFNDERQKGLLILVKSNKNGRYKTSFAKLVTYHSMIIILCIFLYGTLIFLTSKIYGFGNLNRSIQSIPEFKTCTLLISVKQYLVLYFGCKVLANILIGMIFAAIFSFVKNSIKSYIIILLFLLVNYAFYILIDSASMWNFFKYVNIFSFLNSYGILGEYRNVNLFSIPIWLTNIFGVISTLVICTLVVLCSISYSNQLQNSTQKSFYPIELIKRIIDKLLNSVSIMFLEFYKLILCNKLYLILIIMILVGCKTIANQDYFFSYDDSVYRSYINRFQGKITSSKINIIENEKEIFDNLDNDLNILTEQYNNRQIDSATYYYKSNAIQMIGKKQAGFERFYNQYIDLNRTKAKSGFDVQILDEISASKIFNTYKSDLQWGIYVSILLIIFSACVFSYEYKNNAINIIKTTKYGHGKIFVFKQVVNMISIVVILLLTYIPRYINIAEIYGFNYLSAPIQSIQQFSLLHYKITVLQLLIIYSIYVILGSLVISQVIIAISLYIRDYIKAMVLSTIVVVLPIIIEMLGADFIHFLSLNNVFTFFERIGLKNGVIINCSYIFSLIIISLFLVRNNYIKFTNGKER